MKRLKLPFLTLGLIAFLFSGCGLGDAADKAESQSKQFHAHMKRHDITAMMGMVHEDAKANNLQEWENLFKTIEDFGAVRKVKKNMGFQSNVNNGVHTVTLNYTLEFDSKKLQEEIIWQDSKDGSMKIISLYFN